MSTWTFTGTIEQLRDLFDYDPDTGVLLWRARDTRYAKDEHYAKRWNTRCAGKHAEVDDFHGYYQTAVNGKIYRTHRICYALANGIDLNDVPPEIDHANGAGIDNSKNNLRGTDRLGNTKNGKIRKRNKTGYKGVTWDAKSNGYRAAIMFNRVQTDKRGFATAAEAHAWYVEQSKLRHGAFGCGNNNGTHD